MKVIEKIDIMHEKKLVLALNFFAIPLFFFFLFFFSFIVNLISPNETSFEIVGDLKSIFIFLANLLFFLVILVIHELIHGLFFKLYKPENKLKFGVLPKSMMAYCSSPGSIYKRYQMIIIAIAPFILISLFLTILYSLNIITSLVYIGLASMHASGCVGDFYYLYLLFVKYLKKDILVEDTLSGLIIYEED